MTPQPFISHAPDKFLPFDVRVDDALEVLESSTSISGVDRALRGLMVSKNTWETYSSSGRQGTTLPSTNWLGLANNVVVAIVETAGWSSCENLATSGVHISSCPGAHDSA